MPKQKWTFHTALFFLFCIFILPQSSNAESIKRADTDDVHMLLSAASGENSAYWAAYIGETRNRVYIEYATLVHAGSLFSDKPKYVVYWLLRSELTEEQLELFRRYKTKFLGSGE